MTDPTLFRFKIRRSYGCAVVELEVYGDGDFMFAGIRRLRGRINLRPMSRRWYAIIRGHIHRIERICKRSGCCELRVAGRKWSRVLTDYEPYAGVPNGLRKAL